ncbi:mitochondrial protein, forms a heterodimer complex with Mto1p [Nadsonia fulvescens var. elongata DSM 6958]|uniref:Mitochondrial protein, forms a heterodimer complex with Mto1p n=1 Tax=Nadsonia fulvescens var. elongata DSM 6958 TaxID=857566 RepID=A0A1E3PDT2_9ASCO|nr:mitochondrial protein, forms a heterodimer complex with Mto1p [Nadsonia fulvescens var. elongata DSM 6958]
MPTIYALSTAPAKAAIAIVRVSGTHSREVYKLLTRRVTNPKPRVPQLSTIYNDSGEVIDHALTLFFAGPKSYSGEDLLELHLHGGTAIVRATLDTIKLLDTSSRQIRYAEGGEFSRRAFQNGRLDLTQIEGIRDIIDAQTESQRKVAIGSASGKTKALYESWRTEIVKNMALLTALIDFSEDADIESAGELFSQARANILILIDDINKHFKQIERSELLMSGIKLNLMGPPNAGKSSILNLIANRDAAIVSNIAGTTRDILEISMDIGGYKVVLGDTAGLRKSKFVNEIEAEGIRRAKNRFKNSDIVLTVISVPERDFSVDSLVDDLIVEEAKALSDKEIVVIVNKTDFLGKDKQPDDIKDHIASRLNINKSNIHLVSCLTNNGIPELLSSLTSKFSRMTLADDSEPIGASQRVKDLLQKDVLENLERFVTMEDHDVAFATEELRYAAEGIGKITGDSVGIEEVLGVVFSSFCVGK